jgi:S-DNA-T family DNA segregation ATPase FtsK/SpoIIIE
MATPQMDERAPLTLVKDTPETATVFEFEKRPRPGLDAVRRAAAAVGRVRPRQQPRLDALPRRPLDLLPGLVGARLPAPVPAVVAGPHDDYRQQIASAKQMLRAAKGKPADEARAKALVDVRRAEYKEHKKRHWIRTGISGLIVIGGATAAFTLGSWWMQLLLALAFVITGAYFGRPDEPAVQPIQAPTRTSHLGEETMRRVLVEAGAVPEKRASEIRGVGIPHREGPGIAFEVDMPSGIPAAAAVAKKQQVASALAVHQDWLDLEIGTVESRLKIWAASEDPFSVVRRSPLLDHEGPINTFRDGIKVAVRQARQLDHPARPRHQPDRRRRHPPRQGHAARQHPHRRRERPVGQRPHLRRQGLRRAQPVRTAPVHVRQAQPGAAGHHQPDHQGGVDRRSDLLDDHGFEKIDDDNYEEAMKILGGREVFVCDELATYTPKGTSPWDDEITENLSQIAAVGAAVGVLLVSITQVPEVAVIRGRLRQNHVGRAAMNTESGTASNTILGDGMTGQGYDASKIPLDQPGRFWLATPETGVIQGRSYLVKPDDKRRVVAEAYEIRKAAGRLPGQWRDPIEEQLLAETGVSSVAGGEGGKGRISASPVALTLLDHLIGAAEATGRREATRAEVFAHLATVDERYGYRVDETDAQYSARAGKLLAADMATEGLDIKTARVLTADGKDARGFRLDDLEAAGKS